LKKGGQKEGDYRELFLKTGAPKKGERSVSLRKTFEWLRLTMKKRLERERKVKKERGNGEGGEGVLPEKFCKVAGPWPVRVSRNSKWMWKKKKGKDGGGGGGGTGRGLLQKQRIRLQDDSVRTS